MKEKINSALKFMRRNRTFTKLVSFILSVVMVFYVIPNTVYTKAAEILNSIEASDSSAESDLSDVSYSSIPDNEYGVLFDDFGNQSEIKAGNNTLAIYEYEAFNGKLSQVTYGNGHFVKYVYNDLEMLKEISYNCFTVKNEVDRIFSADGTKSIYIR